MQGEAPAAPAATGHPLGASRNEHPLTDPLRRHSKTERRSRPRHASVVRDSIVNLAGGNFICPGAPGNTSKMGLKSRSCQCEKPGGGAPPLQSLVSAVGPPPGTQTGLLTKNSRCGASNVTPDLDLVLGVAFCTPPSFRLASAAERDISCLLRTLGSAGFGLWRIPPVGPLRALAACFA